ncbi:MAG: hypothetical protein B7Z66_03275 [Chromatiales bacterium 21-64-14]|nr:MAG: hypothetical protein B7Z66_03275 [Chromatiales bacterium 21-64-14]HQU15840.1 hypothetical protein [Gammaproteobacteria bacterium]
MTHPRERPKTELERHYRALSLEERMRLALCEDLPDGYRELILRKEQWMHVRVYFARRVDLRPQEVEALLGDADHVIRLCIAKRHDLTSAQVACCVEDVDPNVRYFIARNPLLTDAQRQRLMVDGDPMVRRAAAKGPRAMEVRQRPGQARLVR